MEKKKRIVIALGGNALGNTLPERQWSSGWYDQQRYDRINT